MSRVARPTATAGTTAGSTSAERRALDQRRDRQAALDQIHEQADALVQLEMEALTAVETSEAKALTRVDDRRTEHRAASKGDLSR